MPMTKTFHYNSIDANGRKTKGTVEAPNEIAHPEARCGPDLLIFLSRTFEMAAHHCPQ